MNRTHCPSRCGLAPRVRHPLRLGPLARLQVVAALMFVSLLLLAGCGSSDTGTEPEIPEIPEITDPPDDGNPPPGDDEPADPGSSATVSILSPQDGATWTEGTGLRLSATATGEGGEDLTDAIDWLLPDIGIDQAFKYLVVGGGSTADAFLPPGTFWIHAAVYDGATLLGGDSVQVHIDPMSGETGTAEYVYFVQSADGTVSAMDVSTGTVVSTLDVGFVGSHLELSPDGSYGYISSRFQDSPTLSVIDLGSHQIEARFDITGFSVFGGIIGPTPAGGHAYMSGLVGNETGVHNALLLVDLTTGLAVDTVLITTIGYSAGDIVVSPDGARVFGFGAAPAPQDALVVVVDASTREIIDEVWIGPSSVTEAVFTPDGSKILLARPLQGNDHVGALDVFDPVTLTTDRIDVHEYEEEPWPRGVAVSPDGTEAWFADFSGKIWVVDLATGELDDWIALQSGDHRIDFSPDGRWAYVSRVHVFLDEQFAVVSIPEIVVIDVEARRVTAKFPLEGSAATDVAVVR